MPFVLLAAVLWVSCKSKSADDSHLPPKVMEQVVKDISMAEAYSTLVKDSLHKGGSKNMDSLSVYYKDIFAHYKITGEQFSQSLDWYKDHASEMDTMYSNLIIMVTKLQNVYPATKIPLPDNKPSPVNDARFGR